MRLFSSETGAAETDKTAKIRARKSAIRSIVVVNLLSVVDRNESDGGLLEYIKEERPALIKRGKLKKF